MLRHLPLLGLTLLLAAATAGPLPDDPAAAWDQVNAALNAPTPGLQLPGRLPTRKEMDRHRQAQTDAAVRCADFAAEFVKRFPSDQRAGRAREICRDRLDFAVRRGLHDRLPELERVELEIVSGNGLDADQRFALRAAAVERAAIVAQARGEDMLAAYETGVRRLQKDFPGRPELAQMLYAVAVGSTGEKARQLADEVRRTAPNAELRDAAGKLVRRAQQVGQPIRIRFTAVDGSSVDTADLAGKVILVDFWATWSGPSIANLPKLVRLREKHADDGLVLLGISTDHDRNALNAFLNFKRVPWPQCFDNDPKTPSLAESLGVEQIPALWLIDRQGRLREMNAGRDLEGLVSQLLDEEATEDRASTPRPTGPR